MLLAYIKEIIKHFSRFLETIIRFILFMIERCFFYIYINRWHFTRNGNLFNSAINATVYPWHEGWNIAKDNHHYSGYASCEEAKNSAIKMFYMKTPVPVEENSCNSSMVGVLSLVVMFLYFSYPQLKEFVNLFYFKQNTSRLVQKNDNGTPFEPFRARPEKLEKNSSLKPAQKSVQQERLRKLPVPLSMQNNKSYNSSSSAHQVDRYTLEKDWHVRY